MKRLHLVSLTALLLAAPVLAEDKSVATFKREAEITLEGDPFFDYVYVDSAAKRLYVAHSPNVDVVDLDKRTRVGVIEGVNGAHGIAIDQDLKKGFATSGKKNKAVVFDIATLKTTGEIKTGANPDAVLFVSSAKELWTMNGKGGDITCSDSDTLALKGTVKLPDKPEFAVECADKGLVFVNIEDKDSVCAVDIKKHEVIGTYALTPGKGPSGLAMDTKNGLLFSGCTDKLVVFDIATSKVVTALDIGEGCDAVAFDAGTGNVFVSCGKAAKTYVFHVNDAKTFVTLPPIETEVGARTCTVDPATHKLYVCTGPKKGDKGTIKILVYSAQ